MFPSPKEGERESERERERERGEKGGLNQARRGTTLCSFPCMSPCCRYVSRPKFYDKSERQDWSDKTISMSSSLVLTSSPLTAVLFLLIPFFVLMLSTPLLSLLLISHFPLFHSPQWLLSIAKRSNLRMVMIQSIEIIKNKNKKMGVEGNDPRMVVNVFRIFSTHAHSYTHTLSFDRHQLWIQRLLSLICCTNKTLQPPFFFLSSVFSIITSQIMVRWK
ncbi:MAG: hypothetical protein J3R72DRAFT_450754 [Linnemannia gamsii]|nr:MAG: hypothetical protein J3R72DRAFT_450754 [Linnemannia gamsii]